MSKVILYLLFVMPFMAFSKGNKVTLENYSDGKKVKLYWNIHGWPQNVEGFNLKKRIQGTQKWKLLNNSPIRMAISRTRDWSLLGLNEEQKKEILAYIDKKVKNKRFKEVSESSFLEAVQKMGVPSGARISFKKDFRNVLLNGFGYIDNDHDSSKKYEYALFGVEAGDKEQSSPRVIAEVKYFKPDSPDLKTILTFQAVQRTPKREVVLEWAKKGGDVRKYGFLGYRVYRKEEKAQQWTAVVDYPLGERCIEGPYYSGNEKYPENRWKLADGKSRVKRWRYKDEEADPQKVYTYAVAPVNMFQVEFVKTETKYDPEDFKPLPPVTFKPLEIVEDKHVKLSWEMDQKALKKVQRFEVYAMPGSPLEKPKLVSTLPASTNSYIDKSEKKKKQYYTYMLKAIDIFDREYFSKRQSFVYMRWEKPPKVTGLKARYEIKEPGRGTVYLTWDKKSLDDKVTDRYHIATDNTGKEGVAIWNASLLDLRDNKHSFHIEGEPRSYTAKVRAVAPQSENCEVSEWTEVKIDVGRLELPDPIVRFKMNRNGFFQADWKYPALKVVKGFRIFADDKLILDNIDPKLRSVVIKKFSGYELEDGDFYFELQAFSDNEKLVSDKVGHYYGISSSCPRQNIPAPKDFKIVQDKTKDGLKLNLSWKDVPMEGVYEYELKVHTFNPAYAPEDWDMTNGWPLQDDDFSAGEKRIHNWPAKYSEGRFIVELWVVIKAGKRFLRGRRAFVEINLGKKNSTLKKESKSKGAKK